MLELLAPAQNKQCAISAINFGADAVYIGAPSFGARKKAGNSIEDIREVVDYAHKFYVKVYVTINTILDNNEIIQAVKLIGKLNDIGVDAIIIQDMGLLEQKLPSLPLIASTQCNNRTLEKVKFLENIGFQRVILARELSLNEIEHIAKNTNIELETFIHGALCVSYSGQCYLSHAIGKGRSANRGECAQPCRKKYTLLDVNNKIVAKNKYLLCLKDFNASKHIKKLAEIGVKSFKIEGRLKDESYVKNVVGYYRKLIDDFSKKTSSGKVFFDFEPDIERSFNRGFTDYFLQGRVECFSHLSPKSIGKRIGKITKIGKNCFEINCKEIHAQDGLCYFDGDVLKGFMVNKTDGNKIFPREMPKIKSGTIIYRNFDALFEKQLKNSKTIRKIGVALIVHDNKIKAIDEDGNVVVAEFSSIEFAQNKEKAKENFAVQISKTGESDFYVTDIKFEMNEIPFMKISEINELRRNLLASLMRERLKNYKREVQKPLRTAPAPWKTLDYRANVHNDFAKEFYKKCGCEITEFSFESDSSTKNRQLMHTKYCIKHALGICSDKRELYLLDEKGEKYKLEFDCKACEMTVYSV